MRNATVTTLLWSEAIVFRFLPGVISQYLMFCGIVFNVIVVLLLVWG